MEDQLLNLIMFAIPSLIVGAIAFLFFREHIQNEDNRRMFLIHKQLQKESLPQRFQAYERFTLFLERINPNKLLLRIAPVSSNKNDYETLLISSIEQEFEHNLSQQVYISDSCWSIINASKSATIQLIRKVGMSDKMDTAEKLREAILTEMMDKAAPSNAALSYIKKEISELW
ncbi:hypothetical protein N7U66_20830 [Lacinutrix neustonica]|uniref:Uncharacterized protein n=1 Tax=Lacinutrix neustonica TaxID=2980107 RepID=A0A9E8SEC5_9FLAO|nr:hypothetical protein [Lacinutrix neustonica]WAC02179.1 hypothetical protein N7U66_20830 [Lacinutrix neustonica]